MNKEWVKAKEAENKIVLEKEVQKAIEIIDATTTTSNEHKEKCKSLLRNLTTDNLRELEFYISFYIELEFDTDEEENRFKEEIKELNLEKLRVLLCDQNLNHLLDSEPMKFDGDIIITDTCYVIKDNDWRCCHYGYDMESLGVNHYMTRDTIYGDWSCTTYNSDTGEEIGGFCADAGLVSVFLLEEILKYNPEFDYHTEKPWTTTLIKDFKGTVQFVVKRTEGVYEDTTEYHKKGDTWTVDNVEVIGHGIDKLTGKPINFVGKQTGF